MAERKIVQRMPVVIAALAAIVLLTVLGFRWRSQGEGLSRAIAVRDQTCRVHLSWAIMSLRWWVTDAITQPRPCDRASVAAQVYDTVGWGMKACFDASSDGYRDYFIAAMISGERSEVAKVTGALEEVLTTAEFRRVRFPDLGPPPVPKGTCPFF